MGQSPPGRYQVAPDQGRQAGSGYPQAGYPQAGYPQAEYTQAEYPAPYQPGYVQPGGSGVPAGRPGMVTAAAVLAFIWGGFAIIGSFFLLIGGSILSAACSSSDTATRIGNAGCSLGGFLTVVTLGLIIVAALLIWGGVAAVSGRSQQILVIACGVYLLLSVVSLIAGSSFGSGSVIGFVAPVLILVFVFNPASKAWFKAKGAKTF